MDGRSEFDPLKRNMYIYIYIFYRDIVLLTKISIKSVTTIYYNSFLSGLNTIFQFKIIRILTFFTLKY